MYSLTNLVKEYSSHTIGVEFGSCIVNLGAHSVKLQIWDTAGQERFRSVTRSYYRGAAGALLVFDITNSESFAAVSNWLEDARRLASSNIVIVLVGHKSDLESERQVSYQEASDFAQKNDLVYIEASALKNHNVKECFLKCAETILTKIESGDIDAGKNNSGIQRGNISLTDQNNDCFC